MGWQREITAAIKGGQPIVLDLDFDPGWKALKDQFEAKATATKTPRYVTQCLNAASHRFSFKSTSEFLKIAQRIKAEDKSALERTYIHFENDVRRYDDFVIARDTKKLMSLQNSFHMEQPFISKLESRERAQFVEDFKNRKKRASSFPRLMLFMPSDATLAGKKGEKGPLIGNPEEESLGFKNQQAEFVALQAIQAHRSDLRDTLTHNRRIWVTACTYVHQEDFQKDFDLTLRKGEPDKKYGLLHMKVTNQNQISTFMPHDMLEY